jgi:hypothetical protein
LFFVLAMRSDPFSFPQALQRAPRYARTSLDISHEPLEICHSDVKKDNFIIDQEGNVCVVDFQHVGVLPKPFASYGLYNTGNAFSVRVGQMIKHPQYKYASVMVYAAGLIQQSGGSCFGKQYLARIFGKNLGLPPTQDWTRTANM